MMTHEVSPLSSISRIIVAWTPTLSSWPYKFETQPAPYLSIVTVVKTDPLVWTMSLDGSMLHDGFKIVFYSIWTASQTYYHYTNAFEYMYACNRPTGIRTELGN
jgi:hypothetical protein